MELHERKEIGNTVFSRVGYVITVYRNDIKAEQIFYKEIGTAKDAFKRLTEAYK